MVSMCCPILLFFYVVFVGVLVVCPVLTLFTSEKKKVFKIRPAFATFLQVRGEVVLAFCPLFHDEVRFSRRMFKMPVVLRYVVINVQRRKRRVAPQENALGKVFGCVQSVSRCSVRQQPIFRIGMYWLLPTTSLTQLPISLSNLTPLYSLSRVMSISE